MTVVDEAKPHASYRFLARADSDRAIQALGEVLAVLEEHEIGVLYLLLQPSPAVSEQVEIVVDADVMVGPLSTVLLGLASCTSITVVSAENLKIRSTFILPI